MDKSSIMNLLLIMVFVVWVVVGEVRIYKWRMRYGNVMGKLDYITKKMVMEVGEMDEAVNKIAYDDVCEELAGRSLTGVRYLEGERLEYYQKRCDYYRWKFEELGYGI